MVESQGPFNSQIELISFLYQAYFWKNLELPSPLDTQLMMLLILQDYLFIFKMCNFLDCRLHSCCLISNVNNSLKKEWLNNSISYSIKTSSTLISLFLFLSHSTSNFSTCLTYMIKYPCLIQEKELPEKAKNPLQSC